MVNSQLARPSHKRPNVLGQAPATKAKTSVEEPPSDPWIVSDRIRDHGDIGIGRLTYLGNSIDLNSSRNSVLRCVVNVKGALPQR